MEVIIDFINTNIDIFTKPFMIRAIFSGVIIAILCSILGVFLTLRNKSYFSEGIAHASLSGIALALVLSFPPIPFALIVAIIMSIGITYFKKNSKIATDSLIGIFSASLFALGVIILSLSPGYQPEITSYLFGRILNITWSDIFLSAVTLIVVVTYFSFNYEKVLYSTFDEESAKIRGINSNLIDYVLNILTAVSIIISVKLVGVVLVTGLLIIPASSAKLIASKFKHMIPLSLTHNLFSLVFGIIISTLVNVPPGAGIVVTSGIIFLFVFLYLRFRKS